MKRIIVLLVLFFSLSGFSQNVTTFASGTPDDGIAIDSNGNIYCSNYEGDTVFRYTPSGEVTSFITGLNTPNGIAFNSNEELFVCDGEGAKIYKYDLKGKLLATYPIKGHPSGIIKSSTSESMIFTIYSTNKLMSLAPDGIITELASGAPLNGPVGLAYDNNNVLYVGNYNDRKIYKLGSDKLEFVAQVPATGPSPNLGFISYGNGKLWGTILGSHKIYTIETNVKDSVKLFGGNLLGTKDGDISEVSFNQPNGIFFYKSNSTLYITDFGSKKLRVITGIKF